MKRAILGAAALAAAALSSTAATAGVYTDDLTKCIVKSASADDQVLMVQWMFAAMSLNPSVKPLSNITDSQRDDYNRRVVGLMERLLFSDCHSQTVSALKYEGVSVLESSFEVLGQVAARGLMNDPRVDQGMNSLETYMDRDKWAAIVKEAGLQADAVDGKTGGN